MRRQCIGMICLLSLSTVNVASAQGQAGQGKGGKDKTDQPAEGVGRSGQVGEQEKGKAGQPGKGVGRSGQATDRRSEAGEPGRELTRHTGQNRSASGDEQIAAILYACDRNQVELAEFAKDRLKSEPAREFAEMMVKEHKKSMEKLQKLAGTSATETSGRSSRDPNSVREDGATAPGRTESPDGAKTRTDKTARVATDAANAAGGGRDAMVGQLNWVQIHQQIADQCLASTKAELERHEGEDFDKAYIGQQLGAHMAMVDHLKVFKTHASEKLTGQLDACLEGATSHLDHARKIMEEQKEGSSEPSSNRENRENRKEGRKEVRKEKSSN